MVSPRLKNLAMLGLGDSVGTVPEGIRADVVVVQSFDDLANKSSQVISAAARRNTIRGRRSFP